MKLKVILCFAFVLLVSTLLVAAGCASSQPPTCTPKFTTRDPSLNATILDSWGRQKDFFVAENFEIIPWPRAKTIMLEGKCLGGKQYHKGWITFFGPSGEKFLTRLAEHDDIYVFFKEHNLKLEGFGTE